MYRQRPDTHYIVHANQPTHTCQVTFYWPVYNSGHLNENIINRSCW